LIHPNIGVALSLNVGDIAPQLCRLIGVRADLSLAVIWEWRVWIILLSRFVLRKTRIRSRRRSSVEASH
jgi:hypothetical protein